MKYLRKFDKHSDYEASKTNLTLPNVSYCVQENDVHYNPKGYSTQYLTFVTLESGTFKFTNAIQYSVNDGETWTTLAANTDSPTVSADSKILWKAELTPTDSGIGKFSSTGRFDVEGNPMSLLFDDNFKSQTSLSGKNYAFRNLFQSCTNLVSAKNLSLPATTLAEYCYYQMFSACTSLTTAPELPAKTLANYCYCQMFISCSALTTAPELPATTLAEQCYSNMFNGCTRLTTAPVLPATTLTTRCYYQMFYMCQRLTTAPELPATTLTERCYNSMFSKCYQLNYIKCLATDISASGCTNNWVNEVASTGTFVKATGVEWTTGVSGTPSGWTVVDA